MATPAGLSVEARYLRFYRHHPAKWVEHHFDIQLARYRSEADLVDFLEKTDNSHAWARDRLSGGRLILDPARSYQAEALELMGKPIRENKKAFVHRLAFKWANGIAKTATAALMVLWFLDCFPGGRVLTTAGTWSQLREQLWREINTWRVRTSLPIVTNSVPGHKTQIDLAPDWSAIGRAAKDEASFEGPHARYMMVIVDEAKAVPPDILENATRRILRGDPNGCFWFVALSSPGSPSGTFYDICVGAQSRFWNVLSCSAYESERIPLSQLDDDVDAIGEASPLYVAMDLGEFPDEGEKTLIPLSWVQAAIGRKVSTKGWRTLGADIAARGADETALVELEGRQAALKGRWRGLRTTFTSGKIHDLHTAKAYDRIAIDDNGVGVGVTDALIGMEFPVLPINFGSAANDTGKVQFVNLKSELYWRVRSELEAGYQNQGDENVGLSLPDDKVLVSDLTAIEYDRDERLRIKVEGHRQLAARNVRSPNTGDALVLANAARSEAGREDMVALPDVLPL